MDGGIVIAGNLVVDYVKQVSCYPQPGMLANILSEKRGVGGCAANTTVDIARMDASIPLKSIGMVGDDENGRYVINVLEQNGIDTSAVMVYREAETSYTDVMSDTQTGERTFFHFRGANAMFSYEHIDWSGLSGGIFHIGYALLLDAMDGPDAQYGTVMAKTLAKASQAGMLTSMDVVSESGGRFREVVLPCLPYCDYVIINEIEASQISGVAARDVNGGLIYGNMESICRGILDLGVRRAVVVHAPEAGWNLDHSGEIVCLKSLDLPTGYIKGSVGAGDAYCAGILYAIYRGMPAQEGMRIARAAAAANLSHENSIDGMRSLDGVLALDRAFGAKE